MSEKFNVDMEKYDTSDNIRKVLLTIMTEIVEDKRNNDISLQDLNIKSLAKIKDFYCSKLNLNQKKPNIENLNRDKVIYGDRPLKSNMIVPEANPYQKRVSDTNNEKDRIDRLVTDRNNDIYPSKKMPDFNEISPVLKEHTQNPDDFMRKLKDLQDARNIITPLDMNTDPAALYRNSFQPEQSTKDLSILDNRIRTQAFTDGIENLIIPKSTENNIIIQKYLTVNSTDRDWNSYPLRYDYGINFLSHDNNIANKYKNIDSIQVGRVIVPCESSLSTDPSFHISFSLPYVILSIDEFSDVYDGTNDIIRKSFCNLIYESSYKAPNGRGFIVLKPVQDEKKQFYPTPLSTIQRLSIKLLKPNGDLLSIKQDSNNIMSIEQDTDPNKLIITLKNYFTNQDFFNSDYILIKNFVISKLVPQQLESDINGINGFINQSNGHEIISLGTVNSNGYYNSFYIASPGSFDASIGSINLNTSIINCLNYYNLNNSSIVPNGTILNQTLQHSISLKLDILVDNAKIIETMII
jgi:hypothetical protein